MRVNERATGLVRAGRRLKESDQRERLSAFGCARIYDWSQVNYLFSSVRQGDVVVVAAAHVLGPTRADVRQAMREILDRRGNIYVLDTGLSADTPDGAAQIALDAVSGITSDRRTLSRKEAKRNGKRAWTKAKAKRTEPHIAAKFWHSNRNRRLSNAEKLKAPQMFGWSQPTCYRRFGPPGDPKPGCLEKPTE